MHDLLTLYRWAVQDPETHATVLRLMHERMNGGPGEPGARAASPTTAARTLREDFAGTSAEAVAWIALDPHAAGPDLSRRRAIAIDLDPPTLDWAAARAARLLGPRAAALTFLAADATTIAPPAIPHADIISVLNFSILYLRDQPTFDAYLRAAHRGLAPGGIIALNVFGGAEATRPGTTTTRITPAPRLRTEPAIAPFDYHWEVRSHEPATARLDCRIHFTIPSPPGPPHHVRDAFRYDWRLWTPAELMGACARAGFSTTQLWRHTYDPSKGAAGVYLGPVDPAVLAPLASWTAYIVAQR